MPVDVSQINALARDLITAGPKVAAGMGAAVRVTAEQVAAQARSAVPVLTGTLRASITTRSSGLTATVEATAPYAEFVEFGTGRQAPEPFLFPAADTAETSLATAAELVVGKALD